MASDDVTALTGKGWASRYSDGQSAMTRPGWVKVTEVSLLFSASDSGFTRNWPIESLRLIDRDKRDQRVTVASDIYHGERLVIMPGDQMDQLSDLLPAIKGPMPESGWRAHGTALAWVVGFIMIMGALIWQLDRIGPYIIPDVFVEDTGNATARLVENIFGEVCEIDDGQAALSKLYSEIGGDVALDRMDAIQVIDSPIVNAVTVANGRILVFRGLIEKAENAEEVAGVIAHELGHVEKKHVVRHISRSMGLELIAAMIGGHVGDISNSLLAMAYTRDSEREADEVALNLLNTRGVDSLPLAGFFERLGRLKDESKEDRRGFLTFASGYLSTHPPSPERAAFFRSGRIEDGSQLLTAEEWASLRGICGNGELDKDTLSE